MRKIFFENFYHQFLHDAWYEKQFHVHYLEFYLIRLGSISSNSPTIKNVAEVFIDS